MNCESMIWDNYRDDPQSVGVHSLRILRNFVNRFTPAVMARVDRERLIRDIDGRIKELNRVQDASL